MPCAKEAEPSKLTDSPLQIFAIVSGEVIAFATGLWQGVEHVIEAANTPVPTSLEVNTRVIQPVVFKEVQVTIVPWSWPLVYVPKEAAPMLSPS